MGWKRTGAPANPRSITAPELARRLGSAGEPMVLDVREPEEVMSWAIPGAINIPLGQLPARMAEVPDDREVVVVCASGNRSGIATAVLADAGYAAANLSGGMNAWGQVYDTVPAEVGGATVVQVRRRGKGCLSYLVGAGDEAFVIDPSMQVDLYRSVADHHGWRITRVFDTHLHADHLSGARLLARHSGATLHLHPADRFDFAFQPLADGEHFALSGGAELTVAGMHTPGHTLGSTGFVLGDEAFFSGDTLFVDGVGRPDLAERADEFARNLYRSLTGKVLRLPDPALVLPAHYGDRVTVTAGRLVGTALGELRTSLPALSLTEEDFVAWAVSRATERPPNYRAIIQANMSGAADAPLHLEAGPNRCSM